MSSLALNSVQRRRVLRRNPYLFALLLLIVALLANLALQPNLFQLRVLNGNIRLFLPLMLLAAGQAIVILGGGIDLSVGAIVSLVNAVVIVTMGDEPTVLRISTALLLALGAGTLSGVFNGIFVSFLRLQPIVTTYATSFVFSGLALYLLPRPGGRVPSELTRFYRSTPFNVPMTLWLVLLLLGVWALLRATRYGRYLYAVGGDAQAAYATGVPVNRVRFSTYVIAGLMAGFAGLALTLSVGTGDPRIGGEQMTLDSIVAVVLGGTRLSGGQGGVAGAVIGVAILGIIRNIISFANVPTWWQTLVDALIILAALAGPGLVRLLRGGRR